MGNPASNLSSTEDVVYQWYRAFDSDLPSMREERERAVAEIAMSGTDSDRRHAWLLRSPWSTGLALETECTNHMSF